MDGGTVHGWGGNNFGQLGNGSLNAGRQPRCGDGLVRAAIAGAGSAPAEGESCFSFSGRSLHVRCSRSPASALAFRAHARPCFRRGRLAAMAEAPTASSQES